LHDKALTGDVIGYRFTTPNIGGFSELPTLFVKQQAAQDSLAEERIEPLELNEENVEVLVWDDEESKRKNYFTLPTDKQLSADHVLPKNLTSSAPVPTELKLSLQSVDAPPDPQGQQADAPSFADYDVKSPLKTQQTFTDLYTVQLGAFLNQAIAIEFSNQLKTRISAPEDFVITELQSGNWQSVYKVFYGQFTSMEEANQMAQQIGLNANEFLVKPLPEKMLNQITTDIVQLNAVTVSAPLATSNSGFTESNGDGDGDNVNISPAWVIQFYASQSSIPTTQAQVFDSIGVLYQAEKTAGTNNETWYCLISQGYTSREEAQQALATSGLEGWVSSGNAYSSFRVFN